jgi:hypothetical protein
VSRIEPRVLNDEQHTRPAAARRRTSARRRPADRAGTSSSHGIDVIPAAERHGRPRELFWVWMSANVNYLYFVLGGVLVLLGLSIWEALAITVVGNLWWAAVGWLAVSGPASGTPSVAIMRAMFGSPRQPRLRRRARRGHRPVLRDHQHRRGDARRERAARHPRRAAARPAPSGACSSWSRC